MRILGIDPSTTGTGWGVVDYDGHDFTHIASGVIKPPQKTPLTERLALMYQGVQMVVAKYNPSQTAIETPFVGKNMHTALKQGQAIGAISVALYPGLIPTEYAPAKAKSAIAGNPMATKAQMQRAVLLRLSLRKEPQHDAADALAIAMTHGFSLMVSLREK